MAFIGFVWVRLRMPFDNNTITDIIINIGAPCLLFSTLLIRRPEPAALAEIAAVGFAILALVGLLAAVVLKLARLELRTYWPALVFPNTGNMGLPLCFLAFGFNLPCGFGHGLDGHPRQHFGRQRALDLRKARIRQA